MPPSNNSNGGVKGAGSSGSSEGCSKYSEGIDEKKRRRMESNRESARRSRQKKQQHLDELIKQVGGLTRDNADIEKKIKQISGILGNYEAQNKVLKTDKDRLADRLESLESIIDIAKVVVGPSSSSSMQTATTSMGNYNYNYNTSYDNNNNNNIGELLYMYEGNSNNNGDPLTMMKPWQLPCPSMPLIPSSGLPYSFKF